MGGAPLYFGTALGGLAVVVLFVWLIARRRKNWARLLFAGVFLIGLWPVHPNLLEVHEANQAVAYLSVLQLLLQLIALFFVFTGDARPWFRRARTA